MKTVAIIAAGGSGRRMRGAVSKQYLHVRGRPILARTLAVFEHSADIDEVILVVPGPDVQMVRERMLAPGSMAKVRHILAGGAQRQDSVRNGLAAVDGGTGIVLIHDAARPFVSPDLISRMVQEARLYGAVTAGIAVTDTVKRVDADGWILETQDRSLLWMTQTPQAFRCDIIRKAYRKADEDRFYATDDAALVERIGVPVKMIAAGAENIKITTPEDLRMAEAIAGRDEKEEALVKTGFGYDSHRLLDGRRLVLGGVEIPHDRGLSGHSDADVLVHAICDAVLGAIGAGDIGRHFPDRDPAYKDVSSLILLAQVRRIAAQRGYGIAHIDSTVVAEQPRLSEHIPAMALKLAEVLDIAGENISIKAKTNEGMGFVGRQEGIAAYAVATVVARGDA